MNPRVLPLTFYVTLLSVTTQSTLAQENLSEKPKGPVGNVGVRLGPSFYRMSGNEVKLRQSTGAIQRQRIAAESGLDIRFSWHKYVYTSFGLTYLQKGGHLEGGNWLIQNPVKNDYLFIPFVFGLTSGDAGRLPVSISAEIGWGKNFLLSSRNDYSNDVVTNYYIDEYNNPSAFLYGFEMSADVFRSMRLFMNYRYTKDNQYFHSRKNDQTGENYDLWNKGYGITVGLRFKSRLEKTRWAGTSRQKKQDSIASRPFAWGMKAGLQLTNTNYLNLPDGMNDESAAMLAPHAGLYFFIRLSRFVSIIPETQFIQKGYVFTTDGSPMKLKLDYVEWPIMISYRLKDKLFIEGGPVVGLFIDAKSKGNGSTIRDWYYADTIDYGAVAGFRYEAADRWSIALRHYQGFNNISTLFRNIDRSTQEFNANFQFSGYYRF